jgi:hypothetical protein
MRFLIALFPLLLCGCTSEVLLSDSRNVVISADLRRADEAQAIADQECAAYGKKASLMRENNRTNISANYIFQCVTP